jgi:hypothetical protein
MHPKPKPLSLRLHGLFQQNHKLPIIDHLVAHNLHILKLGSALQALRWMNKNANQEIT